MTGTIKNLKSDKGFGFIEGEDGKEYFFHHSGCKPGTYFDSLNKGQAVEFTPTKGNKGPRAEEVSKI